MFKIDIAICRSCGGAVRIIACIEDPVVIKKTLAHLDRKDATQGQGLLPRGGHHPLAGSIDVSACGRLGMARQLAFCTPVATFLRKRQGGAWESRRDRAEGERISRPAGWNLTGLRGVGFAAVLPAPVDTRTDPCTRAERALVLPVRVHRREKEGTTDLVLAEGEPEHASRATR